MIPLADQEYLRENFEKELTGGIKIDFFGQRAMTIVVPGRDECRYCEQVRQVLEELRALSPRISLQVYDIEANKAEATRLGIERAPATILRGQLNRPLRFYGFFSGTLFPVLISALRDVSRGTTSLDARLRRRLQRVRNDVPVRLFVSPGSPHAAQMMTSLFRLALENRHVRATAVEVEEFPRLIDVYRIEAVPVTQIAERWRFTGAVSEEELLDQLVRVAEGQPITLGEGLLGTGGRPSTPVELPEEAPLQQRPSGLIIPGR